MKDLCSFLHGRVSTARFTVHFECTRVAERPFRVLVCVASHSWIPAIHGWYAYSVDTRSFHSFYHTSHGRFLPPMAPTIHGRRPRLKALSITASITTTTTTTTKHPVVSTLLSLKVYRYIRLPTSLLIIRCDLSLKIISLATSSSPYNGLKSEL